MIEFLIRRTDGEWFDLHRDRFAEVLKPNSFTSIPLEGWGDHRIRVGDTEVAFSYEDPGIQVSFEGDSISQDKATQIVEEILGNITQAIGQQGKVVPL